MKDIKPDLDLLFGGNIKYPPHPAYCVPTGLPYRDEPGISSAERNILAEYYGADVAETLFNHMRFTENEGMLEILLPLSERTPLREKLGLSAILGTGHAELLLRSIYRDKGYHIRHISLAPTDKVQHAVARINTYNRFAPPMEVIPLPDACAVYMSPAQWEKIRNQWYLGHSSLHHEGGNENPDREYTSLRKAPANNVVELPVGAHGRVKCEPTNCKIIPFDRK